LSGFTTGAITGIVDRLERAGYARRAPHQSDRRSVVVQPRRLRELKEQVAPIFQSLGRAMGEIARHYNAAELAAIGKFFRQTTEVLRNETAKLRSQKQRRTPGNR
jgi:DNA-binding MarR family transcriptional regulator